MCRRPPTPTTLRWRATQTGYEIWTVLLQVRDWAALEREWSESNSSSNPGDVVSDVVTEPEAGEGTAADGGQIETET